MMYSNKVAVAVKANGKVLRELKDTVLVPFGTEYSLLVKNLSGVRAQFRITIDGTDATDGTSIVVPANGEVELERFIKNGNFSQGNRFKFIERTSGIEQHRGIGVTDGLIQIQYQFEQPYQPIAHIPKLWYTSYDKGCYGSPQYGSYLSDTTTTTLDARYAKSLYAGIGTNSELQNAFLNIVSNSVVAQNAFSAPIENDVGITVPGSISNQTFTTSSWFPVETTIHTMVIKMLGETESGKIVTKPVTVKSKPKCVTCGRVNKGSSKFCTECGTHLSIV